MAVDVTRSWRCLQVALRLVQLVQKQLRRGRTQLPPSTGEALKLTLCTGSELDLHSRERSSRITVS